MDMRKSKVLAKMRSGKTALATKLNLADPRAAEIAAMCGFDCVWVDMEHVPNDLSSVENCIRAAKAYDCDTLTRVSRVGGYSDMIRPLEADSTGIMVPHLMSLKDAEYVRYYTKFAPIGRRPIDGGNADGKYCLVNADDYVRQANEERFVIVQIEDPEPLGELDEICKVPGLDMIFFGPADFTQGCGLSGDAAAKEVDRVRRLIAKKAHEHGKFAGTVGSAATLPGLIEMGYNFVSIGADVVALTQYFKNIIEQTKNII